MSTESSTVENQGSATESMQPGNEGVVDQGRQDGQPIEAGSDSSTGKDSGAKGPSTSLEAAQQAVKALGTAADSPPAKDGTEKRPADGKPQGEPEAADADKSLPFHNHPRWKEVTTAKKALEGQVADLSPKAERWDALDAKFRETGLSSEDVGPLFEGGAMLKRAGVLPQEVDSLMKVGAALKLGDREVVKQLAAPVFEAMGLTLVEVLPKEIREQIEQGAITEDAGRRMADLSFESRRQAQLRERAETRISEVDSQREAQAQSARFQQASWAWEQKTKATDADWDRKEPFIVEAIQALVRQRPPQNTGEVEAICKSAYDQVTRIMRSSAPAHRPAVQPTRGNGSSTETRPQPRSSLEAAKLAVRGG